MPTFPQRPSSHILETQSENYLRNHIPDEWTISRSTIDYGQDFTIEIARMDKYVD
jgi:hypothetical protein